MNKTTWGAIGLLLVLAGAAHAAPGVAIRWNSCLGDGGVVNRSFACNTNTGTPHIAVCSFAVVAPLSGVIGVVSTFDIVSSAAVLPAWWDYTSPAGCRVNALSVSPALAPTAVNCTDWAAGQGSSGAGPYTIGTLGPSSASFGAPNAVPQAAAANLVPGVEYFTANVRVDNRKTVGIGSCGGCNVTACIAVRKIEIDLISPLGFPDITLTAPMNGTDSNFITWQGGVGVPALPGGACSGPTSTRNTTWGSVKALYR